MFRFISSGIFILLLTIILLSFNELSAQSTKSVLFLGNSYTAVNNLPQIIADVASSTGDSVIYDSNTPGGYTLEGHSSDANSISKIVSGNWDFVVLQEQSQRPSLPDNQVEQDVYPYAHFLDSIISNNNSCTETVFYMTWGRKNGDASNCGWWPPVCTYSGMDSLLYLRYMIMTETNNAIVSPVGAVWKRIRSEYSDIELYMSDESHPSAAGSYAAACSFYTTIFRKNPLLIDYNFTLNSAEAENIRQVVKEVVFDNLSTWYISSYDPQANFEYEILENGVVEFINISENANSYYWTFGDGNHSVEEEPIHTYDAIGEYLVNLVAINCDYSDTIFHSVSPLINFQESVSNSLEFKIYPNPFTKYLTIRADKLFHLSIVNTLGQLCSPTCKFSGNEIKIDLSSYKPGLYQLRIYTANNIISRKVIKL
ncbi:MAG: hypothetical protein C0595_01085 [Marinilabiliales bacterium]|nr:MAG: hypothetical protein C0595_01085 [Marinilabiliales bacterium]